MSGGALTINVSEVVHETIDGETILIHMGTGTYYSLDGTASQVWSLLERELGPGQIVAALRERYGDDGAGIEASVDSFLGELVAEGLVVAGAEPATPVRAAAGLNGTLSGFEPPVLHKYTDMQEFMLVDPLHDVDETAGWPHAKVG